MYTTPSPALVVHVYYPLSCTCGTCILPPLLHLWYMYTTPSPALVVHVYYPLSCTCGTWILPPLLHLWYMVSEWMISTTILCPHTLAHPLIFPCAVESHLSELQLSKHDGYLNAFSKATPTISGYFHQREVLGVQMSDIKCFRHALHVAWQLKTLYGQGGLLNKDKSICQSQPLGTASLPHVPS